MIVPKNNLEKFEDATPYTVEEVKNNIHKYFKNFHLMPDDVRKNREICLKAIKLESQEMDNSYENFEKMTNFDLCDATLKEDESFIKDAIEANFHVYGGLREELKTRKDIVIHASSFGPIFRILSEICDDSFVDTILKLNVPFTGYKIHPLLDEEEVIFSSFNTRGEFYSNYSNGAFPQRLFGSSFLYASKRLKKNPEFVLKAYERCQINLENFQEKVKSEDSPPQGVNCLLASAAHELFDDKKFVKKLLNISCMAIKYFPKKIAEDAKILLYHYWSLSYTKQLKFIDFFVNHVKVVDGAKVNRSYATHLKDSYLFLSKSVYNRVCEDFPYKNIMNIWQNNKPSNQKAVDIYFHF